MRAWKSATLCPRSEFFPRRSARRKFLLTPDLNTQVAAAQLRFLGTGARGKIKLMRWFTENTDPLQTPPVIALGRIFGPEQVISSPLETGDAGVAQTIALMRQLVNDAKKDPVVNRAAVEVLRNTPQFNPAADAQAIFDFVKNNFRFVNDPIGTQALRPVRETLNLRAGNCANFSMLVAALGETVGYRSRFVTVAADPADPSQFSHIYPELEINGEWLAVDAARPGAALGRKPEFSFRPMRVWASEDSSFTDLSGVRMSRLNGLGCHSCACESKCEGAMFANSLPRNYRLSGYQRRMRARGLGDTSTIAQDIAASTTGIAQIVAAGNPGSVVYGNLTNNAGTAVSPLYLPGGINNVNPFSTSVTSPLGSASISPILLILGVGLFAFLLIRSSTAALEKR